MVKPPASRLWSAFKLHEMAVKLRTYGLEYRMVKK